jgi:hypothetical protein
MCLPSPEVDTSYQDWSMDQAEQARADEEARQAQIEAGLADIGAVFEGGTVGGVTYGGVQPYLDQREQAQKDYYLPQLQDQATNATKDLTYALQDAGLLTSTTAGERQADLGEQYALQEGNILAQIASDISGQETLLNQNRSSIEASLRASGDATAATNQALSSTQSFYNDMPELDPLAQLFAGITAGIGAASNGYQTGQVRAASTPQPLTTSYGRNVG